MTKWQTSHRDTITVLLPCAVLLKGTVSKKKKKTLTGPTNGNGIKGKEKTVFQLVCGLFRGKRSKFDSCQNVTMHDVILTKSETL